LSKDNADTGVAEFELPVTQTIQNGWVIELVASHDVGAQDCSKSYEDVAWTTILGTSGFELTEGSLRATPYLDGFPYFRGRKGELPDLTVSLPEHPSEVVMTLAATLAARASQTNRGPAEWKVVRGAPTGSENVIIASPKDAVRLKPFLTQLSVTPTVAGGYQAKPGIKLLPGVFEDAAVVQAVASKSGATYVIIGEDAALERLIALLTNPGKRDLIRGQVSVVTKDNQVFSIDNRSPEDLKAAESEEMLRYKPEMRWIMGGIILAFFLLLLWIGSKFVKRKPAA
jgi:hypothetical protein